VGNCAAARSHASSNTSCHLSNAHTSFLRFLLATLVYGDPTTPDPETGGRTNCPAAGLLSIVFGPYRTLDHPFGGGVCSAYTYSLTPR
jgi:hypothetical protein